MVLSIGEMPELSGLGLNGATEDRSLTSYSFWSCFRNCRKAAYWRYIENLRAIDKPSSLIQGDAIHQALETWYRTGNQTSAIMAINQVLFPDLICTPLFQSVLETDMPKWWQTLDPHRRTRWHASCAMIKQYIAAYPREDWNIVDLEVPFSGEIINPSTNAKSRSFILGGRVDGIVEIDGEYFIMEHKTASTIDAGYLDKLWSDMQIQLYSLYLRPNDQPITGVVYNILEKPALKMKLGETDAEFELRRADMKQPWRAKQQQAESDVDFQDRLAGWFAEKPRFHRETIYFTPGDLRELQAQLWELTQQYLEAARSDDGAGFYKNTSQCYQYNRACDYIHLCRSGNSAAVRSTYYTRTNDASGDTSAVDDSQAELVW